MNPETKQKLIEFIEAIEEMAQGCVHMTGTDTAGKVIEKAWNLKEAIQEDK